MDLPARVDDLSLQEYEPLRTYLTVFVDNDGRRQTAEVVSQFVKAMQEDGRARAAAKEWACLLFKDDLSDKCTLEVTDGGEMLYKVFLKYQSLLYQGQGNGNTAFQYQSHLYRNGIRAIKGIQVDRRGTIIDSTQARGHQKGRSNGLHYRQPSLPSGPRKASHQTNPGTHSSGARLAATQHGPGTDKAPATSVRPTILPAAAKPAKHSTSKKEKKRKASSQRPPVVTPSDGSEEDWEPSRTHAVATVNPASHRSKRITSDASRQPHSLIETNSAHIAETDNWHRQTTTSVSQARSSLTSIRSGVSHPTIKSKRGAGLPLNGRGRERQRISKVSTQPIRRNLNLRRLRKIKPVRDPRPNKRIRRASTSIPDMAPGDGFKSPLPSESLQELTARGSLTIRLPSTAENLRVGTKARRKRTRLELETAFNEKAPAPKNPQEVLGPDARQIRPLPKKIRRGQVARGAPSRSFSLEHADQLLRDAASNALTLQREDDRPDLLDWTQDKELDAEYEDLFGDDQDEENDVPVTTAPAPAKPPVPAPPRIWAESRQEVCESFEHFRCYHGGVYSKDDIVKGYLLGAHSANRDVFRHDGKLIISHGGGKSESILETRRRPRRYQTDQDQEASDKSVRALLKTWKDHRPISLLADDKYALFPYDLTSAKYTYVVLGLYWISHAWAECQSARDGSGRVVRWKFAFQWCEDQGDPWWLPQQEVKDVTPGSPRTISDMGSCSTRKPSHANTSTSGDSSIQCEDCQEQSPFVYKQGWMCLNPRCNVFWNIGGEEPQQLDYREEFLTLLPQKFEELPNIAPVRMMEMPDGISTTFACSKGWHCTNCGRLSCRYKWEHWECSNCKIRHVINGRVRSPKEFWHQRPSKGFLHSQIGKDSGILACRLEPIDLGSDKGYTNRLTFVLPHSRGRIHLILGTPLSNGEANEIFQMYQRQASTGELRLRRYPLRNHRGSLVYNSQLMDINVDLTARGLLLTNYFSQNSGEPYQYVGGSGQTVPFCEAPECVQRALALIKERSSLALRTDIPYNEILSAAYMERQKMSFHSDSEKGLGPIVASLSLGSAALMHFRLHVSAETPKGKSTHALTLVLRHGDVLIMDGDGVQKYYEHTVVPMNFRIAATARCIGSG